MFLKSCESIKQISWFETLFCKPYFFGIIIKQWGDLLSMHTGIVSAIESGKAKSNTALSQGPLEEGRKVLDKGWVWERCMATLLRFQPSCHHAMSWDYEAKGVPNELCLTGVFFSAKNRQVTNADSQVSSNQSLAREVFSYLETERVVNSQIWP